MILLGLQKAMTEWSTKDLGLSQSLPVHSRISEKDLYSFIKGLEGGYECDEEPFIVAAVYIFRVHSRIHISALSLRRLVHAALTLACKFLQDEQKAEWGLQAYCGNVSPQELNTMELEVLRLLDWRLHVTETEFTTFKNHLLAKGQVLPPTLRVQCRCGWLATPPVCVCGTPVDCYAPVNSFAPAPMVPSGTFTYPAPFEIPNTDKANVWGNAGMEEPVPPPLTSWSTSQEQQDAPEEWASFINFSQVDSTWSSAVFAFRPGGARF